MPRAKKSAQKVTHTAADDLIEKALGTEEKLLDFVGEHRTSALYWLGGTALALAACAGVWMLSQRAESRASDALAKLQDTYHAQVGPAPENPPKGELRFASDDERLAAALKSADELIGAHPGSFAARRARLMKVAILAERGDNRGAYALASGLSASGDLEISGQAMEQQAALARALGLKVKEKGADGKEIELAGERLILARAIRIDSPAFPAASAKLRLADLEMTEGNVEAARKLLNELKDDRNAGEAAYKAGEKLKELPAAPAA